MMEIKIDYTGIETNRWENGIDHDPRTYKLAKLLFDIDFNCLGDSLGGNVEATEIMGKLLCML